MRVGSIRSKEFRRGAVAVEFAAVLPLFLILVVGTIEVGRALEVSQMMLIAVREGGRLAATDYAKPSNELKATNANVINDVQNFLRYADVPINELVVTITNAETDQPLDFQDNPDGKPRLYRITATLPFRSVSYLPEPFFLSGRNLSQSIVMREGHSR